MPRIIFFCLLTALFFVCFPVSAVEKTCENRFLQLISGKHRFRLQVINVSTKKEVHNAAATISIERNRAYIDINAPGYRKGTRSFDLIKGVYFYEGIATVHEPEICPFLRDHNLKHLKNGIIWPEWEPCNNCWYDEFCLAGEISKKDFENISSEDFHVHINRTHDYAYPPRVFIFDREDKWGFEIMIDRTALKSGGQNYVDVIITRNGEHNQLSAKYLKHLASAYRKGTEKLQSLSHENEFLRLQDRLELTEKELTRNFADLDADNKEEILSILPAEGPLARSMKTVICFDNLHE